MCLQMPAPFFQHLTFAYYSVFLIMKRIYEKTTNYIEMFGFFTSYPNQNNENSNEIKHLMMKCENYDLK